MPRGVCNRVAALQFVYNEAIAQGKLEFLRSVMFSWSLYSIGDLYFLKFILLFRHKQLYNPETEKNVSWINTK